MPMVTQREIQFFLSREGLKGIHRVVRKLRGAVGCNNAKMLLVYRHLPNMTPESASESAAVDKMGSLFFAWGKTPTLETTPHRFPTVTGEQGAPQLRRIKIQKLETETRSTEDDDPRETADLCPERRRVGEDGRPRGGGGGDGSSHGWKKGGRPAGGRMDQRKEQGPPPPPSPPPVVLVARERERERERERNECFFIAGGRRRRRRRQSPREYRPPSMESTPSSSCRSERAEHPPQHCRRPFPMSLERPSPSVPIRP
jgi:hypothetical protein